MEKIIVSYEPNKYQNWQMRLLNYSRQHKTPETLLIGLCAGEPNDPGVSYMEVICPNVTNQNNDHYPPYNKPWSLRHWAKCQTTDLDTYWWLLDPDCVLSDRLPEPQEPTAQYTQYMRDKSVESRHILFRHCRRNLNLVRPVGIPMGMTTNQLLQFVDRWCELCLDIRSDRKIAKKSLWIAEMWALNIAAAENLIDFGVRDDLCQNTLDDRRDCPVTHYCYDIEGKTQQSRIVWSKRTYSPWETPPDFTPTLKSGWPVLNTLRQYIKHECGI